MKVGPLPDPQYLKTDKYEMIVRGAMAGIGWTNVWLDTVVISTSLEEFLFDPSGCEILLPETGMTLPYSTRLIVSTAAPVILPGGPLIVGNANGKRDSGLGGGTETPIGPTVIRPQRKIEATLMFESSPEQTQSIHTLELVCHGARVRLTESTK